MNKEFNKFKLNFKNLEKKKRYDNIASKYIIYLKEKNKFLSYLNILKY